MVLHPLLLDMDYELGSYHTQQIVLWEIRLQCSAARRVTFQHPLLMSAHGSRSLGGPSENLRGLGSPSCCLDFNPCQPFTTPIPRVGVAQDCLRCWYSFATLKIYNLYINTFTLLFSERSSIWQNNKRDRKSFHPSHQM
jgi:hypothetical protein